MIGSDAVVMAVRGALLSFLPGKVATFRDRYNLESLPDLTDVLPYEPDTLNNTRYPLAFVMDVDTPVTTRTERTADGHLLGRMYSINITLFCRHTSAKTVAKMRRHYQLAVTEILLQHSVLIDSDPEWAEVVVDSIREIVATVDPGDKQVLGWFDTSFDVSVTEFLPDSDSDTDPPTVAAVVPTVDVGVDPGGATVPAIWP